MKNYQHWSKETLLRERERLVEDIAEWEKSLIGVKSALIIASLTHYIRRAKEKIHVIDAELCYREHN